MNVVILHQTKTPPELTLVLYAVLRLVLRLALIDVDGPDCISDIREES